MSISGKELDPIKEKRTQFVFKGKREHIATINTPNIAYPGQHFKVKTPKGSTDHVIAPNTLKITFDLEIKSTDKARSVVNNVGRALVEKKCLGLVQKRLMGSITPVLIMHVRTFSYVKKNVKRGYFKAYNLPMD